MTDKENPEYYLTYPDSNFVYETENCDSEDFVHILNKENVPLVILFGWTGAKDKYLKNYSKIYVDRGLITFRHLCPPWIMFWQPEKMAVIAENIVKNLSDLKLEKRPIIVHVFSNGGSFQYKFLMRALKKESNHTQVKGIIFDSAPARVTFSNTWKVIQISLEDRIKFLTLPLSFLVNVMWFLARSLQTIQGFILNKEIYRWDSFNHLKKEGNVCPQHFIYSKTDQLTLYEDVKSFIDHRKSLGVEVTSKLYEDTPHVRHYPSNKLSYSRSIFKFVNKCLRK